MKAKIMLITAMAMVLIFALSACQATDVIGNISKTSFEKLGNALDDKVTLDEANKSWVLTSPGGESFLLSKNMINTPDAAIQFDAAPFINAGLDASKLPSEVFTYDEVSKRITVAAELGAPAASKEAASVAAAFNQLVEINRQAIGYHTALDHYGVALGNGNMFEWAKDMSTNDKDMVFVLNPQPFIDAGVDPAKVTDWIFAKVTVMDENGKDVEVDKFLKPYDISK